MWELIEFAMGLVVGLVMGLAVWWHDRKGPKQWMRF
jgi:hypothetical protein